MNSPKKVRRARNKVTVQKTAPFQKGRIVQRIRSGKRRRPHLLTSNPLSIGQQVQVLAYLRGHSTLSISKLTEISNKTIDKVLLDDGGQNIATLQAIVAALGGVIIITIPPSFVPADMLDHESYIPVTRPGNTAYRAGLNNHNIPSIKKKGVDFDEE